MHPELSGPNGTLLRGVSPDDAEQFYRLVHFDLRHFLRCGFPAEEFASTEVIEQRLREARTRTAEQWPGVELTDCVDGIPVGSFGYGERNADDVEIWGWVGKEHARQGHAVDAVRLLTPFLFKIGYTSVFARAKVGNKASMGTLRRLGFTCFGWEDDHLLLRAPSPNL